MQNCGELRTKNGVSLPSSAARALRFGQVQVEKPVESQQNRRAVGRTAAQPGAERHPLVEPDGDAVHAVTVVHQPESLDTDILFGFAVHRQPFGTEIHTRPGRAHDLDFVVKSAHGKHHRFEVVITVRTAAQDIQPQIYFAVCP